jgi:UDP-N-acetylmuramyl pentapeptide synthase
MKNMFDVLPSKIKGAWAEMSIDIEKPLMSAIGPYDIVMVKGSNGSRMGPVVAKLKSVFATRDADQSAEG